MTTVVSKDLDDDALRQHLEARMSFKILSLGQQSVISLKEIQVLIQERKIEVLFTSRIPVIRVL